MARRFSNIFELAEEFLYDPECGTSLRLLGRLAVLSGNAAALTRARGAFEDLWDRRAEEYVYSDGFDSEYLRCEDHGELSSASDSEVEWLRSLDGYDFSQDGRWST